VKHAWGKYGQPLYNMCKELCPDYCTIWGDLSYILYESSSEEKCFNGIRDHCLSSGIVLEKALDSRLVTTHVCVTWWAGPLVPVTVPAVQWYRARKSAQNKELTRSLSLSGWQYNPPSSAPPKHIDRPASSLEETPVLVSKTLSCQQTLAYGRRRRFCACGFTLIVRLSQ